MTRNQDQSALHLISAWASEQRLVLAQVKVEDKSMKLRQFQHYWVTRYYWLSSPLTRWGLTEIAKQIIDKNNCSWHSANHPPSILKSSNGLKLKSQ